MSNLRYDQLSALNMEHLHFFNFEDTFDLPQWHLQKMSTGTPTTEFDDFTRIMLETTSELPTELNEYRHYNIFHSLIFVSTLILGPVAMLLNLGVASFYRKQLRKVVSFIYFILGVSDLCTGICAALHCLLFLVILVFKEEDSPLIYWIAFPTYYITLISFRMSAFVSLVFSVLRTINILSPFTKISRNATYISIAVYFALVLAVSLAEIVLRINASSIASWYYAFFRPGSFIMLYVLAHSLITKDAEPLQQKRFCEIVWVSTIPIILPATLAMLNTILQIYTLVKPKEIGGKPESTERSDNNKKKVSITIATVSSSFFFCSLFTLALPFTSCYRSKMFLSTDHKNIILYMCGYMSMFLNAALNPLILLLRGEKLNKYIRNKMKLQRGKAEVAEGAYGMEGLDKGEKQREKEGSA